MQQLFSMMPIPSRVCLEIKPEMQKGTMKLLSFISFSCYFMQATCCFSQGIISPVWMKTKVSPFTGGFAEAWAVDVDEWGHVYWAANVDSVSGHGHDMLIYKFDADGNSLWLSPLHFGGVNSQQAYVCNAKDTFLYIGGRDAVNGFVSDMLLLKVNKSNGELVWSKTYDFNLGGYNEIDAVEIRDDGIYCGGWAQAVTTGSYQVDLGLLKLDFSGDTIWKNHFGQANAGEHQDGHFVVDDNHIFAAGLWGGTSLFNFYNGWSFLGTFSKSTGEFADSTLFGHQSGNFGDLENALGMTSDGTDLYVTGYTSPATNDLQIMIARFDKNLNLVWNKNWGGSYDESARGIIVNDGKIFIAGTTKSYSGIPGVNQDAVLLVYDTSGNFLSYQTWGDSLTDEFRDLVAYENSIYLSGTSRGNDGDTAFLIKTTVDSVITPIRENALQEVFLYLYPNPFSSQAIFHSTISLHDATLTVENCFGQQVKQMKDLRGQSITFYRNALPGGFYIARLWQDDQVIATKKLIITD